MRHLKKDNVIVSARQTWANNIKAEQTVNGVSTETKNDSMSKFTPEIQYIPSSLRTTDIHFDSTERYGNRNLFGYNRDFLQSARLLYVSAWKTYSLLPLAPEAEADGEINLLRSTIDQPLPTHRSW